MTSVAEKLRSLYESQGSFNNCAAHCLRILHELKNIPYRRERLLFEEFESPPTAMEEVNYLMRHGFDPKVIVWDAKIAPPLVGDQDLGVWLHTQIAYQNGGGHSIRNSLLRYIDRGGRYHISGRLPQEDNFLVDHAYLLGVNMGNLRHSLNIRLGVDPVEEYEYGHSVLVIKDQGSMMVCDSNQYNPGIYKLSFEDLLLAMINFYPRLYVEINLSTF